MKRFVIGADEEKNMERLRRLTQDKLDGDYIVYGSFYTIGGQINPDAGTWRKNSEDRMKGEK